MSLTQKQIDSLEYDLPTLQPAVANYVPAVISGEMVYVSGQLPIYDGKMASPVGLVPKDVSLEEAQEAATLCVRNALAAVKWVLDGDWSRLVRIVRVGVYVASAEGFVDQAKVANGASDWLGQMLGEAGKHCRAAVGVAALPLDAPVEVELMAQIDRA